MIAAQHDVRDPVWTATSRRSWLRFGALVIALGLCGGAQWYIAHGLHWGEATPLFVAAAVAAAALLGRPIVPVEARQAVPVSAAGDWRGAFVAASGFALFVFAIYQLSFSWQQSFDFAAPLVLAGMMVWTAGLALWDSSGRGRRNGLPMPAWEAWLFLAIVALGFFLRFYRFGDFPPPDGFCAIEEPQAGQIPYLMMHEHYRPWEFLGDRWLGVAAFALWGRTITALRFPFIIVSGFTVLALYLLLRQLVARPAALFAAALFAVSRWHLIYARYAHNIFATTLVVVVIYYLCVRVHRGGRWALYPWLGFLSGYTLYTYAGYRGTAAFVVLFVAISVFLHWRALRAAIAPQAHAAARRQLTHQIVGLGLAAIAFIGVLLPLGFQLRNNPTFFFEAAVRATDDPNYYTADRSQFVRHVTERARATAMIFNHLGDSVPTFNLPDRPMLDPISGLLFTLGFAYCAIWARHRFQGYFAFTFLALLLMGSIFVHNFDVRRLQGIIPLIFVLVAFVADRIWQVVIARLGGRARAVLVGVALVAFGFAFRDNYNVYFRGMMNDMDSRVAFQNTYTIGIRYLHTLPSNAYLLMFSDTLNFFRPSDYEWWRGDAVPGKVTADLLPLLNGERGPWTGRELHLFVADPFEYDDIARLLRQRFPNARCGRMTDADIPGHLHFTTCDVPSAASGAPLQQGIRARYFRGDAAEPILERLEPAIAYALLPDVCRFPAANEKPPCRVEWDGTWQVPADGRHELQATARDGSFTATVDGRPANGALDLTAGPHAIQAHAQLRSIENVGAELRWRHDGRWELLQFANIEAATP
jgi:Dolichyl-phosphate-mannose-protein mannosyltransferase